MPTRNAETIAKLREQAVASGFCIECRCRAPKVGNVVCDFCMAAKAARKKRYREQGRCACGADPRPGKADCERCAQRGKNAYDRRVASHRANGLCDDCKAPAEPGKVRCAKHLARARQQQRDARIKALANGFCGSCRRRRRVTKTLCEVCRDRLHTRDPRSDGDTNRIANLLPLSDGSVMKEPVNMSVDAKPWSLPPQTRDFHYHITDVVVQRFRERADREYRMARDHEVALAIDRRLFLAAEKKLFTDIVDASRPSEITKIAQIPVQTGGAGTVDNYVVMRLVRPNSVPAPRTAGGPAGIALGAVDMVPLDIGAEKFATGMWKVAFRQLEGPLTRLLNDQPPLPPPAPIASGAANPTPPTTPQGKTMDMSASRKGHDFSGLNDVISRVGPKPIPKPVPKPGVEYTKGPYRAHLSEREKMEWVDKWAASGKTATQFAKDNGLATPSLCRWINEFKAKNKRVRKEMPVVANNKKVPPRSAEAQAQRVAFAEAQFRLRPYMTIRGPDGIVKLLTDRFGIGISDRTLNELRTAAQKAAGKVVDMTKGANHLDPRTGEVKSVAKKQTANVATARNSGIVSAVLRLMMDGKVRTTDEVAAALPGLKRASVVVTLSNLNTQGRLKRVALATYQKTAKTGVGLDLNTAPANSVAAKSHKERQVIPALPTTGGGGDYEQTAQQLALAMKAEGEAKALVDSCAKDWEEANAMYLQAKKECSALLQKMLEQRA